MKAVRYVLYAVIALIVLAVAAVAIAVAVINPNDYKPQIEAAVEKNTNLQLQLEGDIGWSFIPLGLELNQVEATLEGERFVALEQLIAKIDFWSLIAMSPQVNTFLLTSKAKATGHGLCRRRAQMARKRLHLTAPAPNPPRQKPLTPQKKPAAKP